MASLLGATVRMTPVSFRNQGETWDRTLQTLLSTLSSLAKPDSQVPNQAQIEEFNEKYTTLESLIRTFSHHEQTLLASDNTSWGQRVFSSLSYLTAGSGVAFSSWQLLKEKECAEGQKTGLNYMEIAQTVAAVGIAIIVGVNHYLSNKKDKNNRKNLLNLKSIDRYLAQKPLLDKVKKVLDLLQPKQSPIVGYGRNINRTETIELSTVDMEKVRNAAKGCIDSVPFPLERASSPSSRRSDSAGFTAISFDTERDPLLGDD